MPRTPLPPLLLALASLWGACDAPAPDRTGPYSGAAAQAHGDSIPGRALAAALGCGACHPGAPPPDPVAMDAPSLEALSDRWSPRDLAAYLVDPVPLRAGAVARMPDFRLQPAEAAAVTLHLLRDPGSLRTRWALGQLRREHPGATAERGAAIVDGLNCAGCHEGTGREPWPAGPPVSEMRERLRPEWLHDFLPSPRPVRPFGYYPGSGSRMPDFRLSAAETDSLAAWLTGGDGAVADRADGDPGVAASRAGVARPLSDFGARKAERLLRDHMACLGCHSLDGRGGRIAPALDGAGARLRPGYLRRVVTAPDRAAPGSIMPVPLEDSAMTALITRYLQGRTDDPGRASYVSLTTHAPRRPDRSRDRTAATLYAEYCAACHGADGAGNGFNAAHLPVRPTAHADSAYMSGRTDGTLYDGIHGGGHILGRSHRMPGFGATLSRAEIRGLVAYLRELCSCEQPAWAAAP